MEHAASFRIPLEAVPDEDGLGGEVFMVDGTVGGHPTRLMLDTGAATTCIVDDGRLTPAEDAPSMVSTTSLFAAERVRRQTTASITVGGLTVDDVTIDLTVAKGVPDLLGIDVLGRFCCSFLTADLALEIDHGRAHVGGKHRLTLGTRGHPYIELEWPGGVKALGVFDTGASISVVSSAFAERHPEIVIENLGNADGSDAAGDERSTPLVRIADVWVAGLQFAPSHAVVVDLSHLDATPPMDLIVGSPLIQQADWTFDAPRECWSAKLHT